MAHAGAALTHDDNEMKYLRRLPKFEYRSPRTIGEVCDLLSAHGRDAKLLAGGTDLLLQMRMRETTPAYLIGLKGVAELSYIRELAGGGVAIGAMTPIQELVRSPLIRKKYAVLVEAASGIGGTELRNVATVGGNVAGALPCADLPPTLIALGAKAKLQSSEGERVAAIEDLFPSFGRTIAEPNEVFTEIVIPEPPSFSGGTYLKFHDRQSMDMTTVGVSAFVTWDEGRGVFHDVKIALASSAPVPMRATKAEATLRGRAFDEDALHDAASAVCTDANPRSSWRATREFRLDLLQGMTKRAIRTAQERAAAPLGGKS